MNDSSRLPDRSVAVVLGTRPEIIKLAGLIKLLGPAAQVIYTGQHYDTRLGPAFFEELDLTQPDEVLTIGGSPRGEQIGRATQLVDSLFEAARPLAVAVQGDTNATLAGALAANARSVPLVHVEAGLRSYDRAMPEEHNRVLVDHLADLCCAPTEVSRANLEAEGISASRCIVTGNTLVEALQTLLPSAAIRRATLDDQGLVAEQYVLATFHRPENVDDPQRLGEVLHQLADLPLPVVLPLHPRTAARIESFGYADLLSRLDVVQPLGYKDFLALASESAVLVSDSGGVQEEASVLKRPVAVVRNSTERPEVLGTFARLVPAGPAIGETVREWISEGDALVARLRDIPSPYGTGDASKLCHDGLIELIR